MMTRNIHLWQRQRGVGMIEVLVTILVLAIGLLGLASLQMNSLKQNNQAMMRSLATLMAYDLSDRMRANPIGIENGYYDSPTASANTDCGTTTGCDAQATAGNDFSVWSDDLAAALPDGLGFVCIDSDPDLDVDPGVGPDCDGTGNLYTIYVTWTEVETGGNTTRTFATTFRP